MADLMPIDAHCPANRAADIVGDRWALRIVRAMFLGASRYSDLQAAIPAISPTVLSARLKTLARNGVIIRREGARAKSSDYRLTVSGRDLYPLVKALAAWGLQWTRRNVREDDLDIGALMWDWHRTFNASELPDGEFVFSVTLTDIERWRKWWLIADGGAVELCHDNPGKDVDVFITTTVGDLIAVWQAEVTVGAAITGGGIVMDGLPMLLRNANDWFPVSPVARELLADATERRTAEAQGVRAHLNPELLVPERGTAPSVSKR